MKKFFFALFFVLWTGAAFAQTVPNAVPIGNADFTAQPSQLSFYTNTALTAPRNFNLVFVGQAQGTLSFYDLSGGVSPTNTLTFVPRPGDSINGSTLPVTINYANAYVMLIPVTGSSWFLVQSPASNIPGSFPGLSGQVTSPAGSYVTTLVSGDASVLNTGTLLAARLPALTGDCTTSVGTVATICSKTGGVAFTANATAAVGQLPGTVAGDNAAAGKVGEYLSDETVSGSAIGMTTGVPAAGAVKALSPGDWDVSFVPHLKGGATTVLSYCIVGISTSSTTFTLSSLDSSYSKYFGSLTPFATVLELGQPIYNVRVNITSTANYYGIMQCGFSTSTLSLYGRIFARRVR